MWAIDFDSCINSFDEHICTTLTNKYGCPAYPSETISWQYWTDHALADLIWGDAMYNNPEWTLAIPPKQNAIRVIYSLLNRGDRAVVITDRLAKDFDVVRKWLDMHGLSKIPLLLTDKRKSKVTMAKMEGCTAVIEDSPHWVDMYARCKDIRQIYVMDYPYNRDLPTDSRIVRVSDWLDLDIEEFKYINYDEIEDEDAG